MMLRLAEPTRPQLTAAAVPAASTAPDAGVRPSVLRCIRLGKRIEDRPVLRDVNLDVRRGEYLCILGANGAGKSTLLKVLALLAPPSDGQVELFGRAATMSSVELRGRIGLVGHQSMLYRDLSAMENLVFFGRLYGLKDAVERAWRMLETVGLADRARDPVRAFSRGMTQRVAIARALLHEPELVLADEPFSGLDIPSARSMEALLADLHQQGRTIVVVNHDLEQSLRLGERVVVMRQGRIVLDEMCAVVTASRVLAEVVG